MPVREGYFRSCNMIGGNMIVDREDDDEEEDEDEEDDDDHEYTAEQISQLRHVLINARPRRQSKVCHPVC
jgi:hypothetical protein